MSILNSTIIVTAAFCIASCGGISDHGNERVSGVVTAEDGSVVAGVMVTLLPDEYNHITDSTRIEARQVITGEDGRYVFDSLDAGSYAIHAEDRQTGMAGIVKNVIADQTNSDAPQLVINSPGSIYFPVDSSFLDVGMVIYLPGLKSYDAVDAKRIANLTNVPSGRITIKAYDPSMGKVLELGKNFIDIEIIPGVTLLLPSRSPTPYCVENDTFDGCVQGHVGDVITFSPIEPSKKIDGNYSYRFSWGEGTISEWSSDVRWHWTWDKPGRYFVQSQVMRQGTYLAWSEFICIEITGKQKAQ